LRIVGGKNLIHIGKLPRFLFKELTQRVESLTEDDWQPIARPKGRDVIYFKYNSEHWNNGEDHYQGRQLDPAQYDNTTIYDAWYDWADILQPILDHIIEVHFQGLDVFVNKCFFNRLGPQGLLWPHWDDEPSMAVSKRVHLVVKTHPLVDFIINENIFHFSEGDLIEIDNIAMHSVKNNSEIWRIHMVMDFYHRNFVNELVYGRLDRLPNESKFSLTYVP